MRLAVRRRQFRSMPTLKRWYSRCLQLDATVKGTAARLSTKAVKKNSKALQQTHIF